MRHDPATCGGCDWCESQAEARKEAAAEPYEDNGARADEYERGFGL